MRESKLQIISDDCKLRESKLPRDTKCMHINVLTVSLVFSLKKKFYLQCLEFSSSDFET